MAIGILTLHLKMPLANTLKQKRSVILPLLTRLRKEFNISITELDLHDLHNDSIIGCAIISNKAVIGEKVLHNIIQFIESHWPDLILQDVKIEII